LIAVTPGDPAVAALGIGATPEEVKELREQLGLDRPFIIQYADWVTGATAGDLGESITYHQSVARLLAQRIEPTLWLGGGALLLAVLVAVPVGTLAGTRANSYLDRAITVTSTFGVAIPDFVLGAVLVFVFAVKLDLLPSSGYVDPSRHPVEGVKHLILPWLSLAALSAVALARMIRAQLIDVMAQDYIRTARAKGLPERLMIRRHALRNSLLPSLTLFGLILRQVIGGAVIIEILFSIPGIGHLLVGAVLARDYPVVQAVVLYVSVCVVLINLMIDVMYGIVDPRISRA
jgi:peptide/nickel transport system permease protein